MMEKVNIQEKFLVCYAKDVESLAMSVFKEINSTLEINYVLWSYGMVGDSDVYFEKVIEPAIDKADFVLFMLSKKVERDELAIKVHTYCHNVNKSLIPLKIEKGRVRLKKFEFRTNVIDFNEMSEKLSFMEQMHSWLGLVKYYPWSDIKFCSRCGKKIKTNAAFCKWCGKSFKKQN